MSSPRLEYAPKSQVPWHRRRAVQRRLVWVGLLIAALFVWRAAPPAWRLIEGQLILRRCLRFTAPVDRLVFEADPIKATALVKADPQYWNELDNDLSPSSPVASWAPPDWVELIRHVEGSRRTFRLSPPVVVLHERTSPDGTRLLMVLRYVGSVTFEGGPNTHAFEVDLFKANAEPTLQTVRTYQPTMLLVSHPFTRVYFAQPDSVDASHFTFKYETEEGSGTIDGWLRSDHELKLECRDGPEKVD